MKSDYLTAQEAEQLVAALPYEYRPIVVAAIETGFRIGDLCAARTHMFDPRERTLIIKEQKTGKYRTAEVTNRLLLVIQGTAADLDKKLLYQKYLFEREPCVGMCRQTVWRWVTRTWERLHKGEGRNISPHSFRKLYAVNKRLRGASLADIKRDLNHDRIETTMVYALADMLHEAEAAEDDYIVTLPSDSV